MKLPSFELTDCSCTIYMHVYNNYIVYTITCQTLFQGDKLTEPMLMVGIFVILLPVVIILIAWSALGYSYTGYIEQNEVSIDMTVHSVVHVQAECMCLYLGGSLLVSNI